MTKDWTDAPVGKAVEYYCFGCRKRVIRFVGRANPYYKSFCNKAGRVIRMRKVKQ
jgi:hypothetical protein